MASKKSPVNGKWYEVNSLSVDEKLKLGFDKEIVEELKAVNEEKKSLVKGQKEDKPKRGRKKKVDE
jgi:hypothetical protein